MRRRVVMSVRVARCMRAFSDRLDVFFRGARELGSAAGAAEQHLLTLMHEPMRRIGFDTHAANRISQLGWLAMVVTAIMVGLGVHVVLARELALLISLAAEPAPSHNGKVNTENLVLIP
jgi:hypothetical protein